MFDESKLAELKEAIQNSSKTTKVYVGSDSKRNKAGRVRFATIAILHIDGNKGGQVFSFIDHEMDYSPNKNPRLRLVMEAYRAADLAAAILPEVGDRDFEIHLDLNSNPDYKSNTAIREAAGYVLGMTGIKPKMKPQAWAASHCADVYTK
jgi:predicted RNase H-related nuclease YkuK (DUF458 family)